MEVRHLLMEPWYEVRHFSVETRMSGFSTFYSPACHSNKGQGITLVRVSSYEGTSTVSLAGTCPGLHGISTYHVLSHVPTCSAVFVRNHRHTEL